MNETAVGIKCPDCARLPRRARRVGRPRDLVKGALVGAGVSTFAGALLLFVGRGLFGIFIPIIVGLAVGEAVSRTSSRIKSTPIVWIAAAATFAGLIVGPFAVGASIRFLVAGPWLIGSLIAAAAAAFRVSR